MIPAGTGFRTFQDSEVRINPKALESLAAAAESALVTSFPLLDSGQQGENGEPADQAQPAAEEGQPQEPASSLDALLGGGETE